MANSKRKCKLCKEYSTEFVRFPAGTFCTTDHAIEFAAEKGRQLIAKNKAKREKEDAAKHREDKKRVRRNPRKEALLAAQLLSRVSAADDLGYCTCASCGAVGMWNTMDGGHFIAKGDSSYWALDPRNIHPQCKPCNGNGMKFGTAAITYTAWMSEKYGKEFVDHMIKTKKTTTKRSVVFYDEFIDSARKEIAEHKKRIGA